MKKIEKVIIFYFSGTGNTRMIASWFSKCALENNTYCQIFDIASKNDLYLKEIDSESLIIIISPIHGFNYPKITLDFIRSFQKGNNQVVLMNTRAGMKIGNMITPGLTGIAFFLSSFILKKKGYNITVADLYREQTPSDKYLLICHPIGYQYTLHPVKKLSGLFMKRITIAYKVISENYIWEKQTLLLTEI